MSSSRMCCFYGIEVGFGFLERHMAKLGKWYIFGISEITSIKAKANKCKKRSADELMRLDEKNMFTTHVLYHFGEPTGKNAVDKVQTSGHLQKERNGVTLHEILVIMPRQSNVHCPNVLKSASIARSTTRFACQK